MWCQHNSPAIMKAIVFATLLALAVALPVDDPKEAEIIKDDRVHPADGGYSTNFETENGIVVSEAGEAGSKGQTNVVGTYSYILSDGTLAVVKYVADENGFKPDSDLLPVAPAFPHPIPQFVLRQIEVAEQQKKNRED